MGESVPSAGGEGPYNDVLRREARRVDWEGRRIKNPLWTRKVQDLESIPFHCLSNLFPQKTWLIKVFLLSMPFSWSTYQNTLDTSNALFNGFVSNGPSFQRQLWWKGQGMGVKHWFFGMGGQLREARWRCSQSVTDEQQVNSAEGDSETEFSELLIK